MLKNAFIIGGSGRIGNALCDHVVKNNVNIHKIQRSEYYTWKNTGDVLNFFEKIKAAENDVLIYAAGIINPRENFDEMKKVNLTLPAMTCSAARSLGMKATTIGTVLEDTVPPEAQNPYVKSKYELQQIAREQWLHLQLHTIFGGTAPTDFMFIGQILNALNSNTRFSMTSGMQHREYHHVEDEAKAIFGLASKLDQGCFDISHGDSIRLKDLAHAIFAHFKKDDLLGIGDLKSPEIEIYEPHFGQHDYLKEYNFRETIPAITKWLEAHVQ